MSDEFNSLDTITRITDIRKDQILIIQRKSDKRRILVKAKHILENEIIISIEKNDYFNFDMYMSGHSWVQNVWALPLDVELTAITNNTNEFPR